MRRVTTTEISSEIDSSLSHVPSVRVRIIELFESNSGNEIVPSTPVVRVAISRHCVSFADFVSIRTSRLLIGNLSGNANKAFKPNSEPNSRGT
jgi:hypothetical protein